MIAHSQLAPLPAALPFRVISKTIGQGAYACIKKACTEEEPNNVFAVKFIHKDYATRHGRLSKKQLDLEVSLHKYLSRHPNLVQFFASEEDQTWRWIAMELAEGGDLFDKIESDVGVGEDVAHFYFTQLISAIEYMHSKGIGHRDIKPENILLSAEGDLKIADFGLAVMFEWKGQKKMCTTSCGSPPYTAPEVLACDTRAKRKLDNGYQGDLVDIWSCAIVLFVLLIGNTPWDEPLERSYEYYEFIKTNGHPRDDMWGRLPSIVADLLRGMMRVEPAQRMSIVDIKSHGWFRRQNRYLLDAKNPDNQLLIATDMFENMKVDLSQDVGALRREPEPGALMDLDGEQGKGATGVNYQSSDIPERIVFDWESQSIVDDSDPAAIIQSKHLMPSNQSQWDQVLSDDPSCSQFLIAPHVPLTRTQFARKFRDIIPSHSLTRFFSFLPVENVFQHVVRALQKLDIPFRCGDAGNSISSNLTFIINIVAKDARKCQLHGDVFVEVLSSTQDHVVQVTFTRTLGDPVEWRRIFKKVVVLCQNIVFRPNDTDAVSSQMSMA